MKIEAGKFYRTRDGRKAYVAAVGCPFEPQARYPAVGWTLGSRGSILETWSMTGAACIHLDSINDLIAPWIEPPWDYTPKRGEWVWSHNGSDYYPWFINCPDVDVKHLLEHGYLFARMDQPPPPPGGSHA